jgi:hypothetical protein
MRPFGCLKTRRICAVIATLMFVSSALLRAIRKTGRGVSLVGNAYYEASRLSLATRKTYPFSAG